MLIFECDLLFQFRGWWVRRRARPRWTWTCPTCRAFRRATRATRNRCSFLWRSAGSAGCSSHRPRSVSLFFSLGIHVKADTPLWGSGVRERCPRYLTHRRWNRGRGRVPYRRAAGRRRRRDYVLLIHFFVSASSPRAATQPDNAYARRGADGFIFSWTRKINFCTQTIKLVLGSFYAFIDFQNTTWEENEFILTIYSSDLWIN